MLGVKCKLKRLIGAYSTYIELVTLYIRTEAGWC